MNPLSITNECFKCVAASISHAAVCVATALGMQASEEAVKELKEESGESTIAEELQEAPQNVGDGVLFLFCLVGILCCYAFLIYLFITLSDWSDWECLRTCQANQGTELAAQTGQANFGCCCTEDTGDAADPEKHHQASHTDETGHSRDIFEFLFKHVHTD